MLRFFRRRSRRGKHLLGAAVTGIPSVVPAAVRAAAPVAPLPPELVVAVVAQAFTPPALPPDLPVVVAGLRVELGFRDGSTAALAPGSDQAKALSDLASVLTQRD
jgi:hypothetical protein